jgi:hypothetical protein
VVAQIPAEAAEVGFVPVLAALVIGVTLAGEGEGAVGADVHARGLMAMRGA